MLTNSLRTDTDPMATGFCYGPRRWKQANPSLDRRYHFSIADGIGAEIVEATSYEKFAFHFRAPVHMLVAYEQGTRYFGETCVEGAPRSNLRDFARKLTFVPAHHEYGEWQEPRTLARLMYVYFDPVKLHDLFDPEITGVTMTAKLFFEDVRLLDTALTLKRSLESTTVQHSLYSEALGLLLVHELIRFNGGTNPSCGANWQTRRRSQPH